MKRITSVGFVLLLIAIAGCGGGGDTGAGGSPLKGQVPSTVVPLPPGRLTVVPRVTIDWGARSRSIGRLNSALSAVVHLKGAKLDGGDLVFTVNRLNSPGGYAVAVKAPDPVYLGQWPFSVTFFAQPDGAGAMVGTAETQVDLASDGTLPDVSVASTIKRVAVAEGQQVRVGERCDLHWAAYDGNDTLVAVTPGSATLSLMDSTDCLRLVDGQLEGIAPGTASVVVLVDGISSTATPVQVNAN